MTCRTWKRTNDLRSWDIRTCNWLSMGCNLKSRWTQRMKLPPDERNAVKRASALAGQARRAFRPSLLQKPGLPALHRLVIAVCSRLAASMAFISDIKPYCDPPLNVRGL